MSQLSDKLKSAGLTRVIADLPEWSELLDGDALYVRELSAAERGAYESELVSGEADFGTLRAKLVSDTLVNEDGDQVFDGPADVADLSGSVVGRLSDLALEVSGLTEDAVDDAVKD